MIIWIRLESPYVERGNIFPLSKNALYSHRVTLKKQQNQQTPPPRPKLSLSKCNSPELVEQEVRQDNRYVKRVLSTGSGSGIMKEGNRINTMVPYG